MPDSPNVDIKKEIAEIADYLGCNSGELVSEVTKLLAQYLESIKLPEKVSIVEIPDFPESRLFAEAYAKGQAKGKNEAINDCQAIINQHIERLRK